ncbi:MAG: hypothetical protein R3C19_23315 [Planctomycetaceae bacterium]
MNDIAIFDFFHTTADFGFGNFSECPGPSIRDFAPIMRIIDVGLDGCRFTPPSGCVTGLLSEFVP